MRSLSRALVLHGRIQTTDARARELRRLAERLVTYAKKNTLVDRRNLSALLGRDVARKFMKEMEEKFSTRNGGYTRIIKQGSRRSDGAKLAIIEFV